MVKKTLSLEEKWDIITDKLFNFLVYKNQTEHLDKLHL